MLKFILISIIIIYALYKISGFVMRLALLTLGKKIEKKIQEQQEAAQGYSYDKWSKKEKKPSNQLGNDADFVDYEEVK